MCIKLVGRVVKFKVKYRGREYSVRRILIPLDLIKSIPYLSRLDKSSKVRIRYGGEEFNTNVVELFRSVKGIEYRIKYLRVPATMVRKFPELDNAREIEYEVCIEGDAT